MKKGFTLLEVLISLTIISFLVTMFIFYQKDAVANAKKEVQNVNTISLQNAILQYFEEHGELPLKSSVSLDSFSKEFQTYFTDTLQQETGNSDISFLKNHMYTLDYTKLKPYIKSNTTIKDFVMIDENSPYLRGFLFSTIKFTTSSPYDAFLQNKDDQVLQISRGYDHVLVLLKNGDVYGWGANNSGQLGDGTTTKITYPTKLHTGISSILGSGHHTFAKKTDGTWVTWGRNDLGQFADGTFVNQTSPKPFTLPAPETDVKDMKSKGNHTLLLLKDGHILSWGYNTAGQLGIGNTQNQNKPVYVKKQDGTLLSDVVQIETGNWSSFAKTKDGTWYAWGRNFKGSLGEGTETNRNTPTEMIKLSPYYKDIVSIDSGTEHSLFLLKNGEVLSIGNNVNGQLGSPSTNSTLTPVKVEKENGTLNNIQSVMAGNTYSAALSSDGMYYLWGDNTHGELCNKDGTKRMFAYPFSNQIRHLSVQGFQVFFTKPDGNVWACGVNTYGQIGDGTTTNHFKEYPAFQTHEKKDL